MPRTKRKDKSRAVLRTGESQRADGTYQFRWTDSNHKRFAYMPRRLTNCVTKKNRLKRIRAMALKLKPDIRRSTRSMSFGRS